MSGIIENQCIAKAEAQEAQDQVVTDYEVFLLDSLPNKRRRGADGAATAQ